MTRRGGGVSVWKLRAKKDSEFGESYGIECDFLVFAVG
jgi:hypothetical protein